MKLRKEIRDKPEIRILIVDEPVSLGDCAVLAAGLRKLLSDGGENWAIDLSHARIHPDAAEELNRVLLECSAECPENFWIIGTLPWAHLESLQQLEELILRPQLAKARLESWYQQRTMELESKRKDLSAQLQGSKNSPIFELRREQSRLKRRVNQLEKEIQARGTEQPKPDPAMNRLHDRILSTLEHAIAQAERQ